MQGEEILEQLNTDILIIKDGIYDPLLNNIVETIESKKKKHKLSLFLITNGGDGDTAFKIARYLQSKYKDGYEQYVIDKRRKKVLFLFI